MLDFMRSRVQSVWTKVLFSIIVLVFVFWGVDSFDDNAQVQTVATVNEDPISLKEFQQAYRNVRSHYQELYKERFT
ncbi:MAG: SurA N-terminal domain-containing protein, partial [Candidatus Poribacteria bacterium]